jgi:ankyrin repeat protein
MSEALYAGEEDRARELLRPDDELTVFEAAAFGRVDRLRSLVSEDPALSRALSDDGFSALHLAIFGRQEEATRILIAGGADLDLVSRADFAQVTPLGTAAFVRSVALARILLEAGADPTAGSESPLSTAEANGDEELAALIREHGV